MAAVIRIEPDDELTAILERIPAGAPCVLVLPPHARALNSIVGARLLSRRAHVLGSAVAVVTTEAPVIAHARAAGVPVADSVAEAERLAEAAMPAGWHQAADSPSDAPPDATDAGTVHGDGTSGRNAAAPTSASAADTTDHDAPERTIESHAADGQQAWPATPASTASAIVRNHSRTSAQHGSGSAAPSGRPGPTASRQTPGTRGPLRPLVPLLLVVFPLVLLVGLIAYLVSGLLAPSASLSLTPQPLTLTGTTSLTAVLNLPPSKHTLYTVPMGLADQREQGTADAIPVRGVRKLPGHVATGRLTLANLTRKQLLVPAGTTFSTALARESFVTLDDVTLPAASETFFGATYGIGYVNVKAMVGGSSGNVPARAINTVPAGFSGEIQVRNDDPTSGGTDRREPAVDQHDLTIAAANLFGVLLRKADSAIDQLNGGDLEIDHLSVDRSPVQPVILPGARTARLTVSVLVHAAYVHRSDLLRVARASLTVPASATLGPSISWAATWGGNSQKQAITLAVTAHAFMPFDAGAIVNAIRGRSEADARAYLNSLKREHRLAAYSLSVSSLSDHLPSDVTRIQTTVQRGG